MSIYSFSDSIELSTDKITRTMYNSSVWRFNVNEQLNNHRSRSLQPYTILSKKISLYLQQFSSPSIRWIGVLLLKLEKRQVEKSQKLVFHHLVQHEPIHLEDQAKHHKQSIWPSLGSAVLPGSNMNQHELHRKHEVNLYTRMKEKCHFQHTQWMVRLKLLLLLAWKYIQILLFITVNSKSNTHY